MSASFLEANTLAASVCVAVVITFIVTLVFSTKIKDWFTGIDAETRTLLTGVEKTVVSNIHAAKTDAVSKVAASLPAPVKAVTAAVTAAVAPAPVAPVAPAPVAPAAPAAPAA